MPFIPPLFVGCTWLIRAAHCLAYRKARTSLCFSILCLSCRADCSFLSSRPISLQKAESQRTQTLARKEGCNEPCPSFRLFAHLSYTDALAHSQRVNYNGVWAGRCGSQKGLDWPSRPCRLRPPTVTCSRARGRESLTVAWTPTNNH